MIMATHPLPLSCFFACRVEKCAVDVFMFICMYALAWVKLGVVCTLNIYVLLGGVVIVVVGAVLSVDNEFFRYHGAKSSVRVC